ncbi:CDK5 and ABL1 enzyme substrate 2 [Sigmodon hispidus]
MSGVPWHSQAALFFFNIISLDRRPLAPAWVLEAKSHHHPSRPVPLGGLLGLPARPAPQVLLSPTTVPTSLSLDRQRQRRRVTSQRCSLSFWKMEWDMVFELEGVELGADGKVVSYAKLLYPTNALATRKNDSHGLLPQPWTSVPVPRAPQGSSHKPSTITDYVKPTDLTKDMNETFREEFPHIKLTLSKIRSLKWEMQNLSAECSLEPMMVSMAYVYLEKLVLQGKLNKQNQKTVCWLLCPAGCQD